MWFQPLSDRLSGVISLCSHACSKYLTLPTLLLSWPLTSIHTAVFPAQGQPAVSAAEKWAVIHNPPHHLPEAIDFCFPNLQKRSRGKIKNTVSLELNKDGEREREREIRFTLLKRYFTRKITVLLNLLWKLEMLKNILAAVIMKVNRGRSYQTLKGYDTNSTNNFWATFQVFWSYFEE